jgi:hypothetical protein
MTCFTSERKGCFMQRQAERDKRSRRGSSWAIFAALGLATACLNPEISNEVPLSESTAALDGPDAGESAAEKTPDTTADPPTHPPEPSIDRRAVVTRNPTRR